MYGSKTAPTVLLCKLRKLFSRVIAHLPFLWEFPGPTDRMPLKAGAGKKKSAANKGAPERVTSRAPAKSSKLAVGKKRDARAGKDVAGPTRRRYEGCTERGASAYKKEWSHFMTGVRVTNEGTSFDVAKAKDHATEAESSTFGYLFTSPTERKKDKQRVQVAEKAKVQKKRQLDAGSRMVKLEKQAKDCGVQLEGMNRKERRAAVQQHDREAAERAADAARRVKPHEMMDPKLAWYQQGPAPLDEVSEKLVAKKAAKHAKQQGLRYNYLAPHPSWLAARRRTRKESDVLTWGTRTVFGDDV